MRVSLKQNLMGIAVIVSALTCTAAKPALRAAVDSNCMKNLVFIHHYQCDSSETPIMCSIRLQAQPEDKCAFQAYSADEVTRLMHEQ